MRWIVASLVVINILVFIYFQLVADSVSSENSGAPVAAEILEAGQGIRLLTEPAQGGQAQVKNPTPKSKPRAAAVKAPKKPVCTLVGSFEKLLKAEYFSERLVALGLKAEVKQIAVTSKSGYWLHLEPEASRKEALRRLSELQRRGIDSYVIPSGDLANGISLGMFSQEDSALALQAKIKKMGYDPKVINVPREQKEIWVLLPQGEAAKLSPERWAELMSSEEYLQKRQNFCADVASA